MRTSARTPILAVVALALVPGLGWPGGSAQAARASSSAASTAPPMTLAQANEAPPAPAPDPSSPPPSAQNPPPRPDQGPPPAPAPAQAAPSQRVPPGQWVFTQQYGWVWMPYGEAFTYVPPEGDGAPFMYVYYPVAGWTWVVAPWVWGVGPWPAFGVRGPARFAWYAHGWWRTPARWHFRPVPAFHGLSVRPAPFRGGVVAPSARAHALVGRHGGRAVVVGGRPGGHRR